MADAVLKGNRDPYRLARRMVTRHHPPFLGPFETGSSRVAASPSQPRAAAPGTNNPKPAWPFPRSRKSAERPSESVSGLAALRREASRSRISFAISARTSHSSVSQSTSLTAPYSRSQPAQQKWPLQGTLQLSQRFMLPPVLLLTPLARSAQQVPRLYNGCSGWISSRTNMRSGRPPTPGSQSTQRSRSHRARAPNERASQSGPVGVYYPGQPRPESRLRLHSDPCQDGAYPSFLSAMESSPDATIIRLK